MELKVITYEESRLRYFKSQRDRQVSRYERIKNSRAFKELPPFEQNLMLSEIGERISFCNDVVEMLEDKAK